MLTNNKIKDIKEATRFLEKRGILLKGTIWKITSQEGGFLKFFRPVTDIQLTINENCTYTISYKRFVTIMTNIHSFSNKCRHSKENFWIWNSTSDFKWRNKWRHKIVKSLEHTGLLIEGVSETFENKVKE